MAAPSVAAVASPVEAPAAPAGRMSSSPAVQADESLYLIGRPPIRHVLRFARTQGVNPPNEGSVIDAWRAAHAALRQIEKDEAGCADDPPITRLGPEYEPLLIQLLKDPLVRHGFNAVPTDVAMVELDRLVVYQKHIDITYARKVEERLGPAPTDTEVFRTCLPYDHPQPPVEWAPAGNDKFVFMSPSNDLRFLTAMQLKAGNITNYPPPGVLAGVLGLAVGFGSNFMNAIYSQKRLILNNGSHRAYALRKLGVTHVPCIIQHASSRHELQLVAPSQVRHDPDFYLRRSRPPMLKDYFNPRLRIVLPVKRTLRQVVVRFEVEEHYVPAV
jgi:hypothetical protein